MRERRPTVAHLIDHLQTGGAEAHVAECVRHLRKFRPVVGCLQHRGAAGDLLVDEGFSVQVFTKGPGFRPAVVGPLRRWLAEEQVDVLHTHLFSAGVWGRWAAPRPSAPAAAPALVVTVHSLGDPRPFKHWLPERLLRRRTARYVAPSAAVARTLATWVPEAQIRHIAHGVDWSRWPEPTAARRDSARARWGLEGSAPVVGVVARLEPPKELALLLDAMAVLWEQAPEARLLVAGGGSLDVSLRARAEALGGADRVQFLGPVASEVVADVWLAADCGVLPSRHEGFGLAALEAMGMGVPVVAIHSSGAEEFVQDGQTGLLVPAGDANGLGAALGAAISDEARRRGWAERARQRAREDFGISRMISALEELYAELVADRGGERHGGGGGMP